MKLWIDDIRPAPDKTWVTAKNYWQAQLAFLNSEVDEVSLDHDLGEGPTGYDLARWLSQTNRWPATVHVHSMNPVGAANIVAEHKDWLKRKAEASQ